MKKNYFLRSLIGVCLVPMYMVNAQINPVIQKGNFNVGEGITYKSETAPSGHIRCFTMEQDSIRRAANPSLPSLMQEEQWLQSEILKYKQRENAKVAAGQPKATLLTLPIVFHIITSGSGATNVAATWVQRQVDQLNLDYRNLAGSTNPVAGDIQIEFCLALRDENDNVLSEPGINRVTSYGAGPFSSNQMDANVKPGTIWNPNDYVNIWVADLSGGLLGYAQFPSNSTLSGLNTNGGSANTDGVVILNTSLGSVANPNPSGGQYGMGRTLTHELGHWLGLRHIWGDGGCTVDDFCNDTPKSDAANYNCSTTNSCNDGTPDPNDMIENYMDYTNDACMDIFTEDQKTRVRTVMDVATRRVSLASSTKCNNLVANDAGISAIISPNGTFCGLTFTPEVTIKNFGNQNLTSATILYNVDGGANQSFNWTGNLAPSATENVTLSPMTSTAGVHTFNAETSNPNGSADGFTGNDLSSSSFELTQASAGVNLPLVEGFTATTFAPTNWSIANGGNTGITWVRSNLQGTAPTAGNSAVIDNYNTNTTGDVDDLNLPSIDLSSYNTASMTFDVAYARYDATYNDQLDVVISTDCGQNWTVIYSKASSTLATDPDQTAGYTAPSTWRNETIDLTPYVGNNKVDIAFRNISGYGQFLYLDNVNLTGQSSSPTANFNASSLQICTGSTVTFTDASSNATSWAWNFGANASPQTANGAGPHTVTYNSAGSYSVSLTINGGDDTANQTVSVSSGNAPTINVNGSPSNGNLQFCQGQPVALSATSGTGDTYQWQNNGNAIGGATSASYTPTSNGSYTVVSTNTSGCSATSAPTNVTINPLPSATATANGSTSICQGQNVTLVASTGAGYTYQWLNNGNNIAGATASTYTASSSGVYSVEVTSSSGCSSTSSNVTVTVNSLPNASITPNGQTTFCAGNSVVLNANTGANLTYQWLNNGNNINGANGSSLTVNASGSYTVLVTNASGCSQTSSAMSVTSLPNPTITLGAISNPSSCGTPTGSIVVNGSGTGVVTWTGSSNGNSGTITLPYTNNQVPAGSYSLSFTTTDGCVSNSVTAVLNDPTSSAAPTITSNAGNSICDGETLVLTSSYSDGNSWSNGASTNSITVTSSGSYSVTYTDASNCSVGSEPFVVTVNPLPTVSQDALPETCLYDAPVSLTGGSPAGGTYSGNGVSNNAFDPFTAGLGSHTITYTYTDVNGCNGTASVVVMVADCNGLATIEQINFSIYPNPANNLVIVESNEVTMDKIELYDFAGKLVYQKSTSKQSDTIDLSAFSSGVYNLRVYAKGGSVMYKLIKN